MMRFFGSRSEVLWGTLFFFVSVLFLGLFFWSRSDLSQWNQKLKSESSAIEKIRQDQESLYSPEIRQLVEKYSVTLDGIESLLTTRDLVFSGDVDADRFDPVVVLDLLVFIDDLRDRLSRFVVINNLSLSPSGKVSFLVRSVSYTEAARQIQLFENGFFDKPMKDDDTSVVPPLFTQIQIGSVVKTSLLLSQSEELPSLLIGKDFSYDFLLQMQLNPDYFSFQKEQNEILSNDS